MSATATTAANPSPRYSLPAWLYRSPAFFELERERIFMRSWQIVCHHSDIPEPGDYFRLDFLNEPIVAVRGDDGRVRAFYNVCRHRAQRLVDEERGHCEGVLRCPYHAWTYDLRGRLVAVPFERYYPAMDKRDWGLIELETEIWLGFVFVRCDPGGPSVAEMMGDYTEELRPYRFEEMRALGRVTLRPRPVNWKNVVDNYCDGLHINVAHTGLRRIAGRTYTLAAGEHVQRMSATIEAGSNAGWSERLYCGLLPEQPHLPPERRRLWSYYLLWPNIGFDVYPDQVDFMQMIPVSPTETLIREIPYALPDRSRAMRAVRYLNWRVNRIVNAEDTVLIERVQRGMASRSYRQGPLADNEICLAAFAERLRRELPVARLVEEPAPERLRP